MEPLSITPEERTRKLRPWYLVAAMFVTGLIGLYGAFGGLTMARLLRGGAVPDATDVAQQAREAGDVFGYLMLVLTAARLQALTEMLNRAFALSVGQALLFGLLFVASSAAMSGRKNARQLAVQAVIAALLFNVVEYVLTKNVRAACIDAVTHASAELPPSLDRTFYEQRENWWWFARVSLVTFQITPLALALLALTRPRTKAFFEAAARVIDAPPDDDS